MDQHLEFLDEIRDSLILMEETLSEKPDPTFARGLQTP